MKLNLDTVFEGEFSSDFNGIRLLRGFVVSDLDPNVLTNLNSETALQIVENVPNMPPRGLPSSINRLCIVVGYRVRGWGDYGLKGAVVYETPAGAGAEHVFEYWYAEKRKRITQVQTQLDWPGAPIYCAYCADGTPFTTPDAFKAHGGKFYPATLTAYASYDELTLTSWRDKPFKPGFDVAINQEKFMGRGKGEWLCFGADNQSESHGKLYRSTSVLWGRDVGWDGYAIFIDPIQKVIGSLVKPEDAIALQSDALLKNTFQKRVNGMVRAQLYPQWDFNTVFKQLDITDI
jgi:hypothetical protein